MKCAVCESDKVYECQCGFVTNVILTYKHHVAEHGGIGFAVGKLCTKHRKANKELL